MKRASPSFDSNFPMLCWWFYCSLKSVSKALFGWKAYPRKKRLILCKEAWVLSDSLSFCKPISVISWQLSTCQENLFIMFLYLVKFRLMFSKEACWASPSPRDRRAASVIFLQLPQWVEESQTVIIYPEKPRLIDFNGLSVCRSWPILSNARSVSLLQLSMVNI